MLGVGLSYVVVSLLVSACNQPLSCAVLCRAVLCRYIALQRDPRFKGIYEAYLSMFESIGLVSEAAPWMQFTSAGLPSK